MTEQLIRRLAFFGRPGAGKSTAARLVEEHCADANIAFRRVRLAEPLYDGQRAIYELAGGSLPDFYSQDGELLNFLGSHLRKINPSVLLDRFAQTVEALQAELNGRRALLVCDDMREPDAEFVRGLNFTLVQISARDELCLSRRQQRGDVSLGAENHVTEQGIDRIQADIEIENETSIEDFRERLAALIGPTE